MAEMANDGTGRRHGCPIVSVPFQPDPKASDRRAPVVSSTLTLRPLGESDLEVLAAALADTAACDNQYFTGLGDRQVSATNWLAWRDIGFRRNGISVGCFDDAGRLLGEVALTDAAPDGGVAALSYWVRLSGRQRGVGLAMARAICAYGFDKLGLECISITVAGTNAASARLALALGARRQGAPQPDGAGDATFLLFPDFLTSF